jgi:hypothetical protein
MFPGTWLDSENNSNSELTQGPPLPSAPSAFDSLFFSALISAPSRLRGEYETSYFVPAGSGSDRQ